MPTRPCEGQHLNSNQYWRNNSVKGFQYQGWFVKNVVNRTSGWIDSGEACQKGWHSDVLLLSCKRLFSCNRYRGLRQSAHPLQWVELVRAGTRDFESPLHRAGISGLVAFIFLPCNRVSKTSGSFEKCLMMCRTNALGSEGSWWRLFVKQNRSDSEGCSQSLHASMQTEDSL